MQLVHYLLPLQKHTWLTFPERVWLAKKRTAHVCQRLIRAWEHKQTKEIEKAAASCVGRALPVSWAV